MRDPKQMILKAELDKAVKKASTKELVKECAKAAVPDVKEGVVALAADVTIGVLGGDSIGTIVEFAVGGAALYGAIRSGVMAHREWKEIGMRIGRRVKDHFVGTEQAVPEKVEVTPLKSSPKLVEQAMSLQGRRI